MKTRYAIYKSGFINDDDTYTDEIFIEAFTREIDAFHYLLTLDADYHYVERQEAVNFLDDYFRWESDEHYGYMNRGNYFGNEITEEMLSK